MPEPKFATCRGCGSKFAKDGFGRQSDAHPRLCTDCAEREVAFHDHHAPGVVCLAQYL